MSKEWIIYIEDLAENRLIPHINIVQDVVNNVLNEVKMSIMKTIELMKKDIEEGKIATPELFQKALILTLDDIKERLETAERVINWLRHELIEHLKEEIRSSLPEAIKKAIVAKKIGQPVFG